MAGRRRSHGRRESSRREKEARKRDVGPPEARRSNLVQWVFTEPVLSPAHGAKAMSLSKLWFPRRKSSCSILYEFQYQAVDGCFKQNYDFSSLKPSVWMDLSPSPFSPSPGLPEPCDAFSPELVSDWSRQVDMIFFFCPAKQWFGTKRLAFSSGFSLATSPTLHKPQCSHL